MDWSCFDEEQLGLAGDRDCIAEGLTAEGLTGVVIRVAPREARRARLGRRLRRLRRPAVRGAEASLRVGATVRAIRPRCPAGCHCPAWRAEAGPRPGATSERVAPWLQQWPLEDPGGSFNGHLGCDRWSRHSDLNRGPAVYELRGPRHPTRLCNVLHRPLARLPRGPIPHEITSLRLQVSEERHRSGVRGLAAESVSISGRVSRPLRAMRRRRGCPPRDPAGRMAPLGAPALPLRAVSHRSKARSRCASKAIPWRRG